MKRTASLATFALLLSGGIALAQQPAAAPDTTTPPPHEHHAPNPQHEAQHLAKMLNLTPDQTAKLEPILADRDQKLAAIHSNGQLTQQDARQQMRAIHESTEQQLQTVLTPEQLQQMKSMHRVGHGPHGGPNQAAPSTPPSV
jgi:Spy/CpxP family protein refolding chaperone